MRLKSIKLAGFKSFVDPTTVPFPSNMTAVVGPNGCGKSNIIDAVRWVMGESSAKYLRGESMTDVIFNGSSARKPVGQASIELVFDNGDGTAPGEFVKFNEISVKRRVSREGQSEYFLNGAKCRRRDITDLFLGTGLGPRSYAIIGQGMISTIEPRSWGLRPAMGSQIPRQAANRTVELVDHPRPDIAGVEETMGEQHRRATLGTCEFVVQFRFGSRHRLDASRDRPSNARREPASALASWLGRGVGPQLLGFGQHL